MRDPDQKWYHIPGMTDKEMHQFVGLVIFFITGVACLFFLSDINSIYTALAVTFSAGVIKEIIDKRFDLMDLLYTMFWPLALSIPFIIYKFLS